MNIFYLTFNFGTVPKYFVKNSIKKHLATTNITCKKPLIVFTEGYDIQRRSAKINSAQI